MKNKLREFWIEETLIGKEKEPWYLRTTPNTEVAANFVHIREVDPAYDALVLEMVEALKKLGPKWLYWKSSKQVEGQPLMYESRTIHEIESLAKEVLAKYDAYVRGEKK